MKTSIIINSESTDKERESDGRFALKMESKTSISRWAKKAAQDAKRREELEAMYGEDACMYA